MGLKGMLGAGLAFTLQEGTARGNLPVPRSWRGIELS